MENNENLIVVRQLPIIEEKLRQIKADVEARVGLALSMACTEETRQSVKAARAELSKEFNELEARRKEVKAAVLAPYEAFEKLYKECAADIYRSADAQLKSRIDDVENGLKQQKAERVESFFNEYRQSLGINAEYSPAEQELIRKYGFKPMCGNTYQLYSWHDVWFSVYCCFELACIQDRALFSSLSDITIGIEWNKDTLYFDHVSSSLARDLHCYVIESNTSQYGGSGVIQPQSSVTSELIRTKGGDNYSILTTDIDIQALREAQYPDIADRKPFKPLPPIFDRGYIKARYDGSLWRKLNSELERHQQEKM